MLILAFDTSGMYGSVALLEDAKVLAERTLSTDRRSAQTLAPAIAEILTSQQIGPQKIQLVTTTIGPGSFTGLRVGVTAAKTFAYAIGADVIGVSTLEAIASGTESGQLAPRVARASLPAEHAPTEIHAVLDAQRKELFVGRFMRRDAVVHDSQPGANLLPESRQCVSLPVAAGGPPLTVRLADDCIIPADEWLSSLKPGTIVGGAGLDRVKDRLPPHVIVDPAARDPRAAIVGQIAFRDYQAGRREDLWELAPVYLRPSYAEEKAVRKTPPTSA